MNTNSKNIKVSSSTWAKNINSDELISDSDKPDINVGTLNVNNALFVDNQLSEKNVSATTVNINNLTGYSVIGSSVSDINGEINMINDVSMPRNQLSIGNDLITEEFYTNGSTYLFDENATVKFLLCNRQDTLTSSVYLECRCMAYGFFNKTSKVAMITTTSFNMDTNDNSTQYVFYIQAIIVNGIKFHSYDFNSSYYWGNDGIDNNLLTNRPLMPNICGNLLMGQNENIHEYKVNIENLTWLMISPATNSDYKGCFLITTGSGNVLINQWQYKNIMIKDLFCCCD